MHRRRRQKGYRWLGHGFASRQGRARSCGTAWANDTSAAKFEGCVRTIVGDRGGRVDDVKFEPNGKWARVRIEWTSPENRLAILLDLEAEEVHDLLSAEEMDGSSAGAAEPRGRDVPELPHGTVTLLFTDVEGSTRLARLLGVRYDESLAAHRRLLREAFAAHGGVEVDTQGDAFFFAFERARDAVGAAAAAQRALAAHDWPQGEPVQVRMGVHTGEPELSAGGYYVGVDLTRGARICAAAHGGQVVLSQATRDLVGDGFEVRDLGDYRLKGVPRPERLFQLVAPGLGFDFPPLEAQRLGNLPLPRTPLVGRREETQQILDALGGRRC